ncbi:phosphoribosylaminoimidazolesuccinocarboxamide synthase [Tissierella creatinophila]|uniref:Phosphoribosylaminoimidazole-succinocarboxamide synthase n=1 Tax=Tissierella creatinophila DSM 6911 TaxID=1123403 RepID=A0A1U7M782_TISCR|nr:phosphoribosylaminoimidazolesuccinocarboxamide synthase [Tissierella creatinophila]OLS03172.1 phosphoribosylaminoimidazole-succinocarboxamide synthase [Tissierella creatinophila DSM 6911]
MELLYKGKTKDVYELDDQRVILKFKDDVTGVDGKFDPGANTVGLSIDGMGKSGLKVTRHFFEKLNHLNIPTHFLDADIEENTMTVLKASAFGKGVEVICRYRAVGSFIRRYGMYANEGDKLDSYVEFTLKDDERGDPLITKDALDMLHILNKEEYDEIERLTKEICGIIREELSQKGLELYDIKLEFGRVGEDRHIALIDEISGGNMRVYRGNEYIEPLDLEKMILSK